LDKGIATDSDSEDSVTVELYPIEDDRSDWYVLPFIKNAGWEGICNVREELLSMRTTEAIVGLSATFSWTQSNPMWMHLIISQNGIYNILSSPFPPVSPCLQNLSKVNSQYWRASRYPYKALNNVFDLWIVLYLHGS